MAKTKPVYERQTGGWSDSPWHPFDPEKMGMSPIGVRAFKRFARLLRDGRSRKFNFARYRPQIGTQMSLEGDESTPVRLRKEQATDGNVQVPTMIESER